MRGRSPTTLNASAPQKRRAILTIYGPQSNAGPLIFSALALLVARIRVADNANHAVATNDLAVSADLLDRCSYFHLSTPKRRRGLTHPTRTSVILQIGLLHDRVVLMGHHVTLYLSHEVHHHNNYDQQ